MRECLASFRLTDVINSLSDTTQGPLILASFRMLARVSFGRPTRRTSARIIDAIREARAPFSPAAAVEEFAQLLKSYRISQITGDRYAGEFPRELSRKLGIRYELAGKTKSDLFRDLLPLLNSGSIVVPRNDRLISQLVSLERTTSRAGKDNSRPPNGHDDVANAMAGAADLTSTVGFNTDLRSWIGDDTPNGATPAPIVCRATSEDNSDDLLRPRTTGLGRSDHACARARSRAYQIGEIP